jgi:hypothetical protein
MSKFRFGAAFLAAVALPSIAQAAVDVQTLFYSGGTQIDFYRISGTQTITGFDTSKGTLTSVMFEASGTEQVDVTPRVFGNLPYTIDGGSSLYFANTFFDFKQGGSGTANFAAAPITLDGTVFGSKTFTSNFSLFTSGNLSSYVRSDSPKVSVNGNLVGANPNPPVVSGTAITIKISYFYDKVGGDVPEPATWAMMVMGFGAVGVAMRTRKTGAAFA